MPLDRPLKSNPGRSSGAQQQITVLETQVAELRKQVRALREIAAFRGLSTHELEILVFACDTAIIEHGDDDGGFVKVKEKLESLLEVRRGK